MLMFAFRSLVIGAVTALSVSLAGSTASAQHHGGGHHSGHGGGHYGGYSGGHRGGHYGGYSGSGFSLSIGSGSPYGLGYGGLGYGGLGYNGLGYGAFGYPGPGYGYGGLGGVGYSNYGLGSYGLGLTSGLAIGRFDYANPYSSAYRGYGSAYSPYYSSRYGLNQSNLDISTYASPSAGYVPTDNYQPSYRYDSPATRSYGVPGYNSEFSHQPSDAGRYSAGRFDETYPNAGSTQGSNTGDLRPGMVLPDGSTVISVEPLDSSPTINSPKINSDAATAPKRGEL